MPLPGNRNATQVPGMSPVSFTSFDPVTQAAVQFVYDVNGIYEFGLRFPFNNASTTILNQSTSTTLTPTRARLDYDELNISGASTITIASSPAFIFCRKLSGTASDIITIDGKGGAGGGTLSGASRVTASASNNGTAGTNGNSGQNADLGNTDSTKAPQYSNGISTGGSGGGAGANKQFFAAVRSGGNGGTGGRASLFYTGPSGGAGGSTDAQNGSAGAAGSLVHTTDILGSLLGYYLSHRGGAGGGSGGGGASGSIASTGASCTSGAGGNGGPGGNGGGLLIICCEILDFAGIIRARGTVGSNGTNGEAGQTATAPDTAGGGSGGGGGGGSGGLILVCARDVINAPTFQVTGGAAGSGGTGGAAIGNTSTKSGDGAAGAAGGDGVALLVRVN